MTINIRIKRVYEPTEPQDDARFLVDRLWPGGMSRETLKMDGWIKDVAPSTALRRWFGHDPDLWDGFYQHFNTELDSNPADWQPLLSAARQGAITLLYSARDEQRNNAIALSQYLIQQDSALPYPSLLTPNS